ncbi:kinase-like domain-containing protein [Auriculariales sp. MPI-PUGE-AT-0066]|nr:kinase-like domain-containing protein [Auriculariales sp. MPI-PUGE-AT-0066]
MSSQGVPVTQLYKRLEMIGKGAYGSVHKGVHIPSGQAVAIKVINLDTPDDDVEDIQREVALLSQLRGSDQNNITKYYGCWLDGPRVWIVMDLAQGGSVRTLMKACPAGVVEEKYCVLIMRECLIALVYLHKSNIIHRDLKAANVLITSTGRVMVCDFGVAALLSTNHSKRTTFVGTPFWMAPEVITTGSMYDTKADIWSLGITLYEMATGKPPHADQVGMKALVIIPKAKAPRLPEDCGTRDMREFVAVSLRELPADRLTADELQKTKWIKSVSRASVSLLKELLVRYNRWQDSGGVRESIVGDLEWDTEEQEADWRQSMGWEFDTVRPGAFRVDSGDTVQEPTITAAPTGHAPRSLRALFEQNNTSASPEPFRIPIARPAQLPPGQITPRPLASDNQPPRQNSNESDSSEWSDANGSGGEYAQATARQPQYAGARSGLRSATPNELTVPGDDANDPSGTQRLRTMRSYKDVRASRGLQDISIPPPAAGTVSATSSAAGSRAPSRADGTESSSEDASPMLNRAPPSPVPPSTSSQAMRRQPGTGTGGGGSTQGSFQFPPTRAAPSPSPSNHQHPPGRAAPSPTPSNFQFPPPRPAPSPAPSSGDSLAVSTAPRGTGPDSRRPSPSRTQTLSSVAEMSPQVDRPLTGTGSRSYASSPTPGTSAPLQLRPQGISRQASSSTLTPDGNMTPTLPIRPFVRPNRSGSNASHSSVEGQGLRAPPMTRTARSASASTAPPFVDQSRMPGIPTSYSAENLLPPMAPGLSPSDLLPPSPSLHSPMSRYFGGQSPLTPSAPSSSPSLHGEHPQHGPHSGGPLSGGPSSPLPTSAVADNTPTLPKASPATSSSLLQGIPTPPSIRPLAMAELVRSPAETHAELARTVAELGQWLRVMDTGLGTLLAVGKGADVIEEAAEPEEDSAYLYGNGGANTVHARGGSVPFAVAISS